MAENSASEANTSLQEAKKEDVQETNTKPLQMSFADWKKSKEAKEPPINNLRKPNRNDNKQLLQGGGNRINNNNFNINNNKIFPPANRPPPLPFPLMSMRFGNFGPGPSGPCVPQPLMPPACNMGNMGPGIGPGPRNHRPLQPPPFWEDMMSPQQRPPPIQPPMPKCPSLWNLVPKEKSQQRQNRKQFNQPNKKYKPSHNNNNYNNDNIINNINNSNNSSNSKNSDLKSDAALMPPPPAPGGSNNNSGNNSSKSSSPANGTFKKKKCGGTFVQIDGRWLQRPEAPLPLEEAPPGTKEERQRQWKEYRQAMKPFKNREFHNWKRTVQRLGKLPRDQLDEKQLERLQKAEEYIGAHKAMLTIKHAEQWVQQNKPKSETSSSGQIYVRRPMNSVWIKKKDQNTFQRGSDVARSQSFGTLRAIKGGAGVNMNTAPSLTAPQPVPQVGQFPDLPLHAGYFGQTQGYNSNIYGQEGTHQPTSTNPFFSSYTNNFVKGGTLLPP